jgi:ADP-ribosylglycohydrolase
MSAVASKVRPAALAAERFAEQTYAGVLGKLIGVYLGRPVEGWSYANIRKTFDEVEYYINDRVNWPLIVPDDDISGTFLFYRALEDNGYPIDIEAKTVGDTWLNYIVEDKTVLWWGGLGRSTEHTAYLRLKSGIQAPKSGSAKLNSRAIAEAIGAEIFIDTWAMSNPGNPERAAAMARAAGAVSHDGIAVEAAVLLAAMQAQAFVERDIDKLLDLGTSMVRDDELLRVVGQVREQCAKHKDDWREVRRWLGENHSYGHYRGCCPMVPNHALLLTSFILGRDDFQKGLKIAVSSGWDTDCNAANLGCLNGIRLGLKALEGGPDFRGPVADLMYITSADGGECMTDAVIETRRVRRAAAALAGTKYDAPTTRFAFEYPGSVQGFKPCPLHSGPQAITSVGNINTHGSDNGLELTYNALAKGITGSVSVPTFIDPKPRSISETSYFEVFGSPSLYGTQTMRATVRTFSAENPDLRFYVIHYDGGGDLQKVVGETVSLAKGDNALVWRVPDVGGLPIYRIGLELLSERRISGRIALIDMDWSGAPDAFVMGGAFDLSPKLSPFDISSYWLKSFVSSARHFAPEIFATFCLSHPGTNGVITTGTRDWDDYEVSSRLTLDLHKAVGMVARSRGHRRYYAGIVENQTAKLIKRVDGNVEVLAETKYPYEENAKLVFALSVKGKHLKFSIGGKVLLEADDDRFTSGGAGFLIEEGTVPAYGFAVRRAGAEQSVAPIGVPKDPFA